MTDKSIFTLTLVCVGDTVDIHAAHSGPDSPAFELGMALVYQLTGTDSTCQAIHAAHLPADWVQ